MNNVTVDHEQSCLHVPHIGITLRVLLAVAAEAYKTTPKRTWRVMYKNTPIGSVRIKSSILTLLGDKGMPNPNKTEATSKESANARHSNSTIDSTQGHEAHPQAANRASVVVGKRSPRSYVKRSVQSLKRDGIVRVVDAVSALQAKDGQSPQ